MREMILKIISMRKHLIRTGQSYKNVVRCQQYINKLERWLEAYPKATERQVKKWAQGHADKILFLAPSGAHPAHQSLLNKINEILFSHAGIH